MLLERAPGGAALAVPQERRARARGGAPAGRARARWPASTKPFSGAALVAPLPYGEAVADAPPERSAAPNGDLSRRSLGAARGRCAAVCGGRLPRVKNEEQRMQHILAAHGERLCARLPVRRVPPAATPAASRSCAHDASRPTRPPVPTRAAESAAPRAAKEARCRRGASSAERAARPRRTAVGQLLLDDARLVASASPCVARGGERGERGDLREQLLALDATPRGSGGSGWRWARTLEPRSANPAQLEEREEALFFRQIE